MANNGKQWHTGRRTNSATANKTANKPSITHHHSTYNLLSQMSWPVACEHIWTVFFSRASKGPKSISKDCLSTIKVLASASMLPLNPSEWFQLSWLLRLSNRCGDDFDGSGPGLILQQCTLTKESGLVRFPGRHEFGVKLGQFPEIIKRQKDAKGMF